MRWTASAVGIGTLALVGIPPAAGFFGIAAIVSATFSDSDALLTALVLLAAAASAFAGVRFFTLMFAAPPAAPREANESPRLRDIPLALLAVGALGFGAVVSAGILPIGSGRADEAPPWLIIATFAIVLISSIAAWLGYRHGLTRATPVGARIERAIDLARGGLGVDALYVRGVADPFAWVAREVEVAERANERAIDALGSMALRLSRLVERVRPETARAEQALLLAATVALLAFWTWGAR
jgi:NADH:ubiquinone oxidoreductase subunit 5 (subunit L)/multisubunit Na+/H+ antiporter MnhA subunit